jgi:hypothetical protein
MRRALAALVLLAVGAIAGEAGSDVATRTRWFDEKARAAFARREYARALEYFLWVHEQTPSALAAFNVAAAADLAGDRQLAFAFLDEYMRGDDTDAHRRSAAGDRMTRLKAKLALVRVETEPPGAAVFVDRRELGDFGVAPRTIVVQAGSHEVHLDLPGHRPAVASVRAETGREVEVRVRLEQLSGTIVVQAQPVGAEVTVLRDGQRLATASPGDLIRVPVGPCRVRLEADGHQPAEIDAVVREGEVERVVVVAAPLPPKTGRLLVSAAGRQALVRVDGKAVGMTPLTLREVAVGQRAVEVEAKGCRAWKGGVRIEEAKAGYIDAPLECGGTP